MKKDVFTFRIPRTKPRAHRALFDDDSPFKPKVVKPKNLYKRKPKYRNPDYDDWEY